LHVFAKLFEDRLEWRLETEAFSRREIGSEDDVLDFFVGHFVDIDLAMTPIDWPTAFNKPICSLSSSDKCE
jgi:hypothetical protein